METVSRECELCRYWWKGDLRHCGKYGKAPKPQPVIFGEQPCPCFRGTPVYLLREASVSFMKMEIRFQLNDRLDLLEESVDFDHHGWFLLTYGVPLLSWRIYVEGEYNSFNIRILDNRGKSFGLNQKIPYCQHLTAEDVWQAIWKLKKLVEEASEIPEGESL